MTDPTSSPYATSYLSTRPNIIIAGAGIGGLSLAISLLQQCPRDTQPPNITIFERDTKTERAGREGYTLSIRTDSRSGGVQILNHLGLYETIEAQSINSAGKGTMFIWDIRWREMMSIKSEVVHVGGKGLQAMRVRRNALQEVLASEAERRGAALRWGEEVTEVSIHEVNGTKKPMVTLSNGATATCDLLIAADGSNSKIRRKLRPAEKELDFAGVVCVAGTARYDNPTLVPKPMNRDWGLVIGGGGTGLFLAPVDERSALWSLSYYAKNPREVVRHPFSEEKLTSLLDEARGMGRKFGKNVIDLVNHTDPSTLMVFNAMDRAPFSHDFAQDGPVVWIGDANHAVSPFAGNGANMALIDGWELASCLSTKSTLKEAIAAYDKMFIPRTTATLKMSRWSIDIAHATGLKLWCYTLFTSILRFFFVSGKA